MTNEDSTTFTPQDYFDDWEKWNCLFDAYDKIATKLYGEDWDKNTLRLSRDGTDNVRVSDLYGEYLYTAKELRQIEEQHYFDRDMYDYGHFDKASKQTEAQFFSIFDKLCSAATKNSLEIIGKSDDGLFGIPPSRLWTGNEIDRRQHISIIHSQIKERLPHSSKTKYRIWDVRIKPSLLNAFLRNTNSTKKPGGQYKFPYIYELEKWAKDYPEWQKQIDPKTNKRRSFDSFIHHLKERYQKELPNLIEKYGIDYSEEQIKKFPSDSWFKGNKEQLLAGTLSKARNE